MKAEKTNEVHPIFAEILAIIRPPEITKAEQVELAKERAEDAMSRLKPVSMEVLQRTK
jgi:hypothetical protein